MSWNIRVVDVSLDDDDDQILEFREVYYDHNEEPYGHCALTLCNETLDELGDMIAELQDALEQPVLVDSDFRGYVIGQFIERYEDDDDGVQ